MHLRTDCERKKSLVSLYLKFIIYDICLLIISFFPNILKFVMNLNYIFDNSAVCSIPYKCLNNLQGQKVLKKYNNHAKSDVYFIESKFCICIDVIEPINNLFL